MRAGRPPSRAGDGTDGHGRKLASDVYFYEIEAGGFTGERKMPVVE